MTGLRVVVAVVLACAPCRAQQWSTFPAGTTLPIRFLHAITSGRDSVGTPVFVQTFGALVRDSCVIVPAFTQVKGRVVRSTGGRRLGRRGELGMAFDALETRPGTWVAIHAVLDSLEYEAPGEITDSGVARGERSGVRAGLAVAAPVAAVSGMAVVPAALFEGYLLAHRGPRASILAGEVGALRLTLPLSTATPAACTPVSAQADLQALPAMPRFLPYTENRRATRTSDAINLLFIGAGRDLDAAFRLAGWVRAQPPTLASLAREATAAIASRPAIAAPVSTLYFEGRKQDFAYELSGPNARMRDHIRIWLLDTLAGIWAGAATKDVGLRPEPLQGRVMHRIDPRIDDERDLITRTLEATGCADLLDYVHLPGADTTGRTLDGQPFRTDARSAVIRLQRCVPPAAR